MISIIIIVTLLVIYLAGIIPAARFLVRERMEELVCRHCGEKKPGGILGDVYCHKWWRRSPHYDDMTKHGSKGWVPRGEVRERDRSDVKAVTRTAMAWPFDLTVRRITDMIIAGELSESEKRRELAELDKRIEARQRELEQAEAVLREADAKPIHMLDGGVHHPKRGGYSGSTPAEEVRPPARLPSGSNSW